MARERWGSRLGVILAVAGSAIGLGNFLRFPGKAAAFGGGTFLIPYFISLFLLGLPLMWIEWTIGRFGGGFGHSTAPGMFHNMWEKNRFIKYFGVIGIFGPIVIFIYYTFIESWLLGYSFFAATGSYNVCQTPAQFGAFLDGYIGDAKNQYFTNRGTAYGFFIATFLINIGVVFFGIRQGIEKVCKYALPVLFVLGVVLVVRALTLGAPDPARPEQSAWKGMEYLWTPNWRGLTDATVWLEAAGQIFFTLSVGIGVILTYASYLTRNDDVALSGLTAAAANETAEVVLGGSIVIPVAFAFFGLAGMSLIAGSPFKLGFVTMPAMLQKMEPFHNFGLFGLIWFFLLFLAGVTSSISLAQPAVAFLEDEFRLSKQRATAVFALVTFLLCHLAILGHGTIDELDFWGGTLALVVFGTVETILFAWVFGMDRAWTELHAGSDITIPRPYRFVIKYVTPVFLLVLLAAWTWQKAVPTLMMANVAPGNRPYVLAARIAVFALFATLVVLVWLAWRRRKNLPLTQGTNQP